MNTAQITHALEQDPVTSKKFCGVFPSDKLPRTIDRYPCGFVANTDCARNTDCALPLSTLESIGSPFISHRKRKENSLTGGILIDVNCKVLGRTYVASIAYFTLAIEQEVYGLTIVCVLNLRMRTNSRPACEPHIIKQNWF